MGVPEYFPYSPPYLAYSPHQILKKKKKRAAILKALGEVTLMLGSVHVPAALSGETELAGIIERKQLMTNSMATTAGLGRLS